MRIQFEEMLRVLTQSLISNGYDTAKAQLSARLFTQASCDGVASHGLNRFPQLVEYVQKGWVLPQYEPELIHRKGVFSQWDGQRGPGDCNAHSMMGEALQVAKKEGIGLVALRNSNHWMRPGNYGWQAIEAGCIGICWSNTAPNMVAWGSQARIMGNNPLVIAIPDPVYPVVLDMAMSQYSYGKMDVYRKRNEHMPSASGYDPEWKLTDDPAAVLETGYVMPAGFWKGSGLSLMLDMLAAIMSNGMTTREVGEGDWETGLSQFFLAIDPLIATSEKEMSSKIKATIEQLINASAMPGGSVRYPGQSVLKTRQVNMEKGIPVDPAIWSSITDYSKSN
ncbi:MAG: 3-dehydro-L-gulonate 2-dehydrogenase [Saprospiraceae bacterium]|nr:3-dehydro-L-gulonate 2-dehydrogenase [Saprospiraceae bacterium]